MGPHPGGSSRCPTSPTNVGRRGASSADGTTSQRPRLAGCTASALHPTIRGHLECLHICPGWAAPTPEETCTSWADWAPTRSLGVVATSLSPGVREEAIKLPPISLPRNEVLHVAILKCPPPSEAMYDEAHKCCHRRTNHGFVICPSSAS